MDPSFPISRDLKDSPIARNRAVGDGQTSFMLRLRLPPLSHDYIHKIISAELMSCYHVDLQGFLLTVNACNTPLPHTPLFYSPREQVTHCCPSDAPGKCMRLTPVLLEWLHTHAVKHSAHGNAIPSFLAECQNRQLYC